MESHALKILHKIGLYIFGDIYCDYCGYDTHIYGTQLPPCVCSLRS